MYRHRIIVLKPAQVLACHRNSDSKNASKHTSLFPFDKPLHKPAATSHCNIPIAYAIISRSGAPPTPPSTSIFSLALSRTRTCRKSLSDTSSSCRTANGWSALSRPTNQSSQRNNFILAHLPDQKRKEKNTGRHEPGKAGKCRMQRKKTKYHAAILSDFFQLWPLAYTSPSSPSPSYNPTILNTDDAPRSSPSHHPATFLYLRHRSIGPAAGARAVRSPPERSPALPSKPQPQTQSSRRAPSCLSRFVIPPTSPALPALPALPAPLPPRLPHVPAQTHTTLAVGQLLPDRLFVASRCDARRRGLLLLLLDRPVELHRVNEGRLGAVGEEGNVRAGGRVFARFLQCGVVVVVWVPWQEIMRSDKGGSDRAGGAARVVSCRVVSLVGVRGCTTVDRTPGVAPFFGVFHLARRWCFGRQGM
ncbi:hypothetical protein IWZ01DRAFT_279123 [Phyllosticta capitalensis]